ncbi:MAG: 50S ribosomal protein L10, partial [Anaerolineae bacterium]
MAISREQKEKMVADYVEKMSRSQALILADYRGLTVSHMTDLRRKLREADGQF